MSNVITKITRTGNGFKERMHVKCFQTSDAMHAFLNAQYDNQWQEAKPAFQNMKSGIYAFAGGQWHNVKKLDASVLAHI